MSPRLAAIAVAALMAVGVAAAVTRMHAEAAVVAADGTPRTAAAVPMFPGLTKAGEEPNAGGSLSDWGRPYPLIEGTKTTYVTTATAEAVYAFYLARLGGKTEWDEGDDHTHIGPNESTPVVRRRAAYEFENTDDPNTGSAISAASQRATLSGARPVSAEGDWIQEGSFDWTVKDGSGGLVDFHVKVVDDSVAPNWTGYSPKTTVEVYVHRYGPLADE